MRRKRAEGAEPESVRSWKPGGRQSSPLAPLVAVGAAWLAIAAAESLSPLRSRREPRGRRSVRNAALAAISAAGSAMLQKAFVAPVARKVERDRFGLLQQLPLPASLQTAASLLLLDYTLWWWHWLNHRVPLLWRFHLVHHVDLDLDASTGIRFHFGELMLSSLFRALQFRLLGPNAAGAALWQRMLLVSIVFHHSNTRLPSAIDRAISRIFVTPRMHGIHHSDVLDEADSNWASLFTCWDFVHGTFREDVPQEAIEIGVPAWQDPADVELVKMLTAPFEAQRDDWRAAGGTSRETRS